MGLVHVDVKALWALKRGLVIDPRPGLLGSLLWLCHFISLWASSSHMILAWMVWFLLDDRTRLLGNFGLVGRPQEFWPWRQSEPCIALLDWFLLESTMDIDMYAKFSTKPFCPASLGYNDKMNKPSFSCLPDRKLRMVIGSAESGKTILTNKLCWNNLFIK